MKTIWVTAFVLMAGSILLGLFVFNGVTQDEIISYNIARISLGMSADEAIQLFGVPKLAESL